MHTKDEWKEDDGIPRFGRKARAWLRLLLQDRFFVTLPSGGYVHAIEPRAGTEERRKFLATIATEFMIETLTGEPSKKLNRASHDYVEAFLGYLVDRSDCLVQWQPTASWGGPGFAAGEWSLNQVGLLQHVCGAADAGQRAEDASACKTLDEWLIADVRGTLKWRGEKTGMQRVFRFSPEVNDLANQRRNARALLRECEDCRTKFKRRRVNIRKCERCCAIAREHREKAKGTGRGGTRRGVSVRAS